MPNMVSEMLLPNFTAKLCLLVWPLIGVMILRSILRAVFSPLRSVPGPFLARFTRFWLLRRLWRGDFHIINAELHRKYGPVVRIAPTEYSISDPSAIATIYGHGTSFIKSAFYDASRNPDAHIADLFSDRDPRTHAAYRRKVGVLYSMTALRRIDEAMHECVGELISRFHEIAQSGSTVDLQHWMQCYAFDVIGAITIDQRFGFLDAGHDVYNLLSSSDDIFLYNTHVGVYPELHRPLFALIKCLGKNPMVDLFALASRQIEAAKQGNLPHRESLLSRMLALHEADPERFTVNDMLMVCAMNARAGSDSTGVALTAVLWCLIKSPAAMEKLRSEIDERTATGEILPDQRITYQVAQNMPYLQAVIQEALRVHPPPGITLPRVVPKGGAVISGVFFSENAVVGMNPWVIHFDKTVFGEDSDIFRPERWLESKETANRMAKNSLAFGYGSRVCIGKNISLIELSTLIPDLVRTFDFKLAEPHLGLKTRNISFVKQKNLRVRIKERERHPA